MNAVEKLQRLVWCYMWNVSTQAGEDQGISIDPLLLERVWSNHGSYFVETQSSQSTHGETKRAWYVAEAYQKGAIRYLPYPNSS